MSWPEKYSFSPFERRHMIFLLASHSIKIFNFKKQEKTWLFFFIGKIHVCLKKSSIKEMKYRLPPKLMCTCP